MVGEIVSENFLNPELMKSALMATLFIRPLTLATALLLRLDGLGGNSSIIPSAFSPSAATSELGGKPGQVTAAGSTVIVGGNHAFIASCLRKADLRTLNSIPSGTGCSRTGSSSSWWSDREVLL